MTPCGAMALALAVESIALIALATQNLLRAGKRATGEGPACGLALERLGDDRTRACALDRGHSGPCEP